jgi:hypothetical protein
MFLQLLSEPLFADTGSVQLSVLFSNCSQSEAAVSYLTQLLDFKDCAAAQSWDQRKLTDHVSSWFF